MREGTAEMEDMREGTAEMEDMREGTAEVILFAECLPFSIMNAF